MNQAVDIHYWIGRAERAEAERDATQARANDLSNKFCELNDDCAKWEAANHQLTDNLFSAGREIDQLKHDLRAAKEELARVKKEREWANPRFPIQCGPNVPWEVMAPHESMALRNHNQTLERLSQRGGLSPGEAWAVVSGIRLDGAETKEQWDSYQSEWFKFTERINLHYVEIDRVKRQNVALVDALKGAVSSVKAMTPGRERQPGCPLDRLEAALHAARALGFTEDTK